MAARDLDDSQFLAPPGALWAVSSRHSRELVDSEARLAALLDEVEAYSREVQIAEMLELRASIDEVLSVIIDGGGDWAIGYDDSVSGTSVYSVNGTGSEDEVEYRFGGEWEAIESQCFVNRGSARSAVLQYLRNRTLSDDLEWA